MFSLIGRIILNALALYIVSRIIPGVMLSDFWSALVAVIVIGVLNALVRPILVILTLPINILTLGLFTFILNALLFMLAGTLAPGFQVDGLGAGLLGSILYSVLSTLFSSLTK